MPKRTRYLAEAKLLEAELSKMHSLRSSFYLAQSYELAGDLERSARLYDAVAAMPADNSQEEMRWLASVRAAALRPHTDETVAGRFLAAWSRRPWRAEPLYGLCRHHRLRGEFPAAIVFGELMTRSKVPTHDRVFVTTSIHGGREAWAEYARALAAGGYAGPAADARAKAERCEA